ncbi:MAG: ATP-binding protein [Prolixibacteraceae bacterium]|jgi:PAS domain S-box-containing protein|nr:ATP-binding protein [Prolixibacteraceae bacterium]
MLKTLINFIRKRHRIDSEDELRKFISLSLVGMAGMLVSVFLLIRDLTGSYSAESISGDMAMFMVFVLFSYNLYSGKIQWAVNSVFLLPFVSYFFYISSVYSAYPVPDSVHLTVWSLLPGFLFLLLFSEKSYKIIIYWGLVSGTLIYHLSVTGKLSDAVFLQWPSSEKISNPLIVATIAFVVSYIVSWYHQKTIYRLKEEAFELSERINKTFKTMHQGMMILEIEHDEFGTPANLLIKKVNNSFESMFKLSSRDLSGKDAALMFPRLFRGAFDWNEMYFVSKKQKFEFHAEHLDRWFEVYNIRPGGNQIISMFCDVSTRQKSIEQLKESRKRFQVLLEAIPDIFFIIDKDGIYVDFMLKENDNIHIDPDEIIGNSIYEVGFSEKMSRKIFQCIQDCIRFDSIETIEYALEVEKGTAMFEMRIAKLNEESVISIARDITKRKIAEIKLEEAKNKAEESDRLKSAFLANISHEIRTPMNAIIGFSKMVSSPDFSMDEKNKFLEIIISNGKLLMTLINDMISLSKIESNQVDLVKSNCLVNDMLVLMYKEFMQEVKENQKVVLKLRNENANPKFSIYTDQSLLKEILEKLLDNALKFTERGTVEFGYRTLKDGQIEFFVKDTGIGIAEEDLDKIFVRFHQLDNRTTRNYEGTGLGLSIAQHYVMLLGGKLKVSSKPGVGSTFYFSLPADNPEGHLKVVR